MGNFYEKPEQKGNSPYTRTGEAIPKLRQMAGSDAPFHRVNNPMSLELHMADERVRQAGLSEAEREWRHKWLKDQHLHTNEPVHVDAVYRQLNPVRLVMRLPMDKLYVHFLRPTFGSFYGYYIRHVVPRALMCFFFLETAYYLYKYENKDWQKREGFRFYPAKRIIDREAEIKEQYPGLWEQGMSGAMDPAKYQYLNLIRDQDVDHSAFESEALLERSDRKANCMQAQMGMEYRGILMSVDGYMNVHLANTEEYIDGTNTGALGEVLIRCNNVLWIAGADETVD